MSKGFAAVQDRSADTTESTTTPISLNVQEQTVTLKVTPNGAGGYVAQIEPLYIRVQENGLSLIRWNVSRENLGLDEELRLDTPGITFFGETPNMVRLEVTPKVCKVLWRNDRPGQSYSYRVHLVLITPDGHGSFTYTPITNDPIVHNDPPTAE